MMTPAELRERYKLLGEDGFKLFLVDNFNTTELITLALEGALHLKSMVDQWDVALAKAGYGPNTPIEEGLLETMDPPLEVLETTYSVNEILMDKGGIPKLHG